MSLKQNNAEQDAYFQLKSAVQDAHDAGYFRPDLHDADLIAQTFGRVFMVCVRCKLPWRMIPGWIGPMSLRA